MHQGTSEKLYTAHKVLDLSYLCITIGQNLLAPHPHPIQ